MVSQDCLLVLYTHNISVDEPVIHKLIRSKRDNVNMDRLHPLVLRVVNSSIEQVYCDMVFNDAFAGSLAESKDTYYVDLLYGECKDQPDIAHCVKYSYEYRSGLSRLVCCCFSLI